VRAFHWQITDNTWFNTLYETFADSRLPTVAVLRDHLSHAGLEPEFVAECVETFTVNAKFLGLLRVVAGAERLLTLDHAIKDYAVQASGTAGDPSRVSPATSDLQKVAAEEGRGRTEWDDVCFYISQSVTMDLSSGSMQICS
jgi:hypothetical protein